MVIYRFNVPRSFKTAVVAELKNPHKAKRSFISVKKAVSSNMFQKENRPCREEEKTFTKEKMAGGKEDETIFKWADEDNNVHIGRYRNMYTVGNEVETLVDQINSVIKPIRSGSTTNTTCIDKKPVLIDGSQPKTFKSQVSHYKEYEAAQDLDDYDDSDILVYAGVPCSFSLAKPFTLCNATAENILIAGGDRDSKVNIILSILNSY